MSKLSRNNIAYDLNISPYKCVMTYKDCDIAYVFSSNLYLKKFRERVQENRKTINLSLSNRFGFNISNSLLADLKLYTSIEKRGFLIYHDGTKLECLSDITLDGQNLTIKI